LANEVTANGINALYTSTSVPPHRRSVSSTIAVTSLGTVTSALIATASPPAAAMAAATSSACGALAR
jgi:hypothetical protein